MAALIMSFNLVVENKYVCISFLHIGFQNSEERETSVFALRLKLELTCGVLLEVLTENNAIETCNLLPVEDLKREW